ncbi:hypothetical protein MTP10_22500 [Nonomuraea sp. 3-1Str]|uniref:hypothetical protein n=1 Tax=Nonomuraea sp. 3-1Str TaxID=2929801 RepID=UPI002855BD54|nr:hypothetical protein [Nonomuraea sp. 3-1Str]MDR8411494.1 hypothetical protein [Nonomuraea sp. 3-1Str]
MVRVGAARAAAARWVAEHARPDPRYRGAYAAGSTVGLPDDAELPPSSDLDLFVVMAQDPPPAKPGKLRYRGVLLEVSHLPWAALRSADDVLGSYHLAGAFRTDSVIDDPTGRLRAVQAHVASHFAARPWVRRRCEDAVRRIEARATALTSPAPGAPRPFHEQVMTWLFAAGVTAHVPLVAALRNPTVRLRYPAVREVLASYRLSGLYLEMLDLLGCSHLQAERVRGRLRELATTFDLAAGVAKTPFPFSSDITPAARPIAIDGSRDLVERGDHREAVFWIIATFARCHAILAADAPSLHRSRLPSFEAALADLGITSSGDLRRRAAEVTRFLPRLAQATEHILGTNPAITP